MRQEVDNGRPKCVHQCTYIVPRDHFIYTTYITAYGMRIRRLDQTDRLGRLRGHRSHAPAVLHLHLNREGYSTYYSTFFFRFHFRSL
jgi:hypothetical protein